jgi:hypothetical protein
VRQLGIFTLYEAGVSPCGYRRVGLYSCLLLPSDIKLLAFLVNPQYLERLDQTNRSKRPHGLQRRHWFLLLTYSLPQRGPMLQPRILSGILLLPSLASAHNENTTAPALLGWVPAPSGRGTIDIIWSCLFTMFICWYFLFVQYISY